MIVSDLEEAKSFYSSIFKFTVDYVEAEDLGWIELSLPIKGVKLGLDLDKKHEYYKETRKASFTLAVKNIDDAYNYLKSHQVEVGEIQDIPNMVSILNCWDPFGNLIRFIAEPRK